MDSSQCLKTTLRNGQTTCTALFNTWKNTTNRIKWQTCSDMHWHPFQTSKNRTYGSFQCSEYGTRKNFQNLNFAIPLVILTWHQMLQEFFWKNSDHTFFELGRAPLGARAYPGILSKYCPSVCASVRLSLTNKRRVCMCLCYSVISVEL